MELEIAGVSAGVGFAAGRGWRVAEGSSASSIAPSLVSDIARPLGIDATSAGSSSATKRRLFLYNRLTNMLTNNWTGIPIINAVLFGAS